MSVNVRNNNIDGALRILRTQSAPTLSVLRDKKEYKKPGVRRREEKKKILLILEEIVRRIIIRIEVIAKNMLLKGDDEMSLAERITEDVKIAMKNQDKEKLNVIRMVKSAIQLAKIEAKHDLSDEEVIDVISKQIKMRKDSIVEFEKASRTDLAENYRKEIEILKEYMPEPLSIEKVKEIIDNAFDKIKPTSPKQMGMIMKEVTPQIKGKFDMGEVSKIIKEKLSSN